VAASSGVSRRPRHDDRGVRRLPTAPERACARPACQAPAVATLSFSYAERQVVLASLFEDPAPQTYDLCISHASRTRPPHGWELRDRRPEEEREKPVGRIPADLGGEGTVAVLAAALRAVPGPVSEDAAPAPASPASSRPPSRPPEAAEVIEPADTPTPAARPVLAARRRDERTGH